MKPTHNAPPEWRAQKREVMKESRLPASVAQTSRGERDDLGADCYRRWMAVGAKRLSGRHVARSRHAARDEPA